MRARHDPRRVAVGRPQLLTGLARSAPLDPTLGVATRCSRAGGLSCARGARVGDLAGPRVGVDYALPSTATRGATPWPDLAGSPGAARCVRPRWTVVRRGERLAEVRVRSTRAPQRCRARRRSSQPGFRCCSVSLPVCGGAVAAEVLGVAALAGRPWRASSKSVASRCRRRIALLCGDVQARGALR